MKLLVLLLFFAVACVSRSNDDVVDDLLGFERVSKPEAKEKRLLKIVREASDKVAAKLNLSPFGFGIEGPEGIQGTLLYYMSYEKAEIDDIRKLMIELGQNLLHEVNLGIERENLEYGKLNLSFFYLSVGFDENKILNQSSGELFTSAILDRDEIIYIRKIANLYRTKKTYTESFEEAYQKIYGHHNIKENSEPPLPQ